MASDRDTLAELIDQHPTIPSRYAPQIADRVIAAGWRPPAREITTAGELDALPYGAIVLAKYSKPFKLTTMPVGYRWVAEGCSDGWTSQRLFDHYTAAHCPLILLYVPTEEAGRG